MRELRDTLQAQAAALRAHAPRVSADADVEELHKLRVAIRRARALLKASRPLIDDPRAVKARTRAKRLVERQAARRAQARAELPTWQKLPKKT